MSGGMACVLFTDLTGSTELMARLGDTAFDGLRTDHFARLREAVAGHGGTEVKNTGDGILATFTSAVDALAAAVAAQQAVERHGRSAGVPLAIRVGLALGEVAVEDGDVFGTPVVEAARLVGVARPGQILATAMVKMVAGSRTPMTTTDLGVMELKGLPEPVAVCEVTWEPSRAGAAIPLPGLLSSPSRVFVGREGELERLAQLWKEAAAGERRVGLVAGEPGIGKTRLAAHVARTVDDAGGLVLAGRCDEDLGVPYQPFVEALRHYAAHADPPRLGRHGGELTRLVPELTDRVAGLPEPLRSDPETERYRLFDAVAAWLADVSAETPVLLVFDDLQWAAKPTLLLLRHVLRSGEPLRLLSLVTYRDSELGRGHPLIELLADLRRFEGVERFPLGGLDQAAVVSFIEQAADQALSAENEGLPQAIWAETDGHPFFVAEVLRHLTESGAVQRREGRWVTTVPVEDLGIPEGVRDVVGRRLDRLSVTTNQALGVASVVGLEFEPAVVRSAGGLGEDELLTALDDAVNARLVAEVPEPPRGGAAVPAAPRCRFAHTLVRGVLYDELTAARRVALHRRVAEAIEALHAGALDDHLPALAHHWARAAAPATDTARAVDYATRAGNRALTQLAHDEAASYYRQALELLDAAQAPPDETRRTELLISLGEAQRRAGDPAHRETLLEAAAQARRYGDPDALARAALANNRGLMSITGGIDEERIAVLETALEAVGPGDSALRARLLVNLAAELGYSRQHQRRGQLAEEALEVARRVGNEATLAHVLAMRYFAITPSAELPQEAAELAGVAARLADPTLSFWAEFWNGLAGLVVGDGVRHVAGLDAAARVAADLGQPFLHYLEMITRADWLQISGRLAEAEKIAREALELGQDSGFPDAFRIYGGHLFWIRHAQGRLDDLVDLLERAARRDHADTATLAGFSLALCELDRAGEAAEIMDRLASDGFDAVPTNYTHLYPLTMAAEVCARLDDAGRATVLYDLLAPHHDLVATTGSVGSGSVAHYLGLLAATLGRLDEADTRFATAAEMNERMGAATWAARTRLEWARMLLGRGQAGDAERARHLLDQTLTAARELGFDGLERQAVALLR